MQLIFFSFEHWFLTLEGIFQGIWDAFLQMAAEP